MKEWARTVWEKDWVDCICGALLVLCAFLVSALVIFGVAITVDDYSGGVYLDFTNLCSKAMKDDGARALRKALDNGADIEELTEEGYTALGCAVIGGRMESVRLLVNRGAEFSNPRSGPGWVPVLLASAHGQVEILEFLWSRGASLEVTQVGRYPAHIALSSSSGPQPQAQVETVIWLLDPKHGGVPIDQRDGSGRTVLRYIVELGRADIAQRLLDILPGMDWDALQSDGSRPIQWAVGRGQVGMLNFLWLNGASVEGLRVPYQEGEAGAGGLLHHAAGAAPPSMVEWLLNPAKGALPVDMEDRYGNSPLDAAVHHGKLEVAKVLIAKGANVNRNRTDGWSSASAFVFACRGGHLEIAKYLLEKGSDVDSARGVMAAAEKGHVEVLEWLAGLKQGGADLGMVDEEGRTAIATAARFGQLEVVKYLHQKGVDLKGLTHAAAFGELEVVKYLVEVAGMDVNRAEGNYLPVHAASQNGHLEVLVYLAAQGANLGAMVAPHSHTSTTYAAGGGHLEVLKWLCSNGGPRPEDHRAGCVTPLSHAAASGRLEVAKFLVEELGEEPDRPADEGRTPLHWASASGDLGLVEYLVGKGAEPSSVDRMGRRPAHSAAYHNHLGVLEWLLDPLKAGQPLFTRSYSPEANLTIGDYAWAGGAQDVLSWWQRHTSGGAGLCTSA